MSPRSSADDPFHLNLSEVAYALRVHQHLCSVYESQEQQFAAALPFLKAGLERHERCLYVADENTAETTLRRARQIGLDIDGSLQTGSFQILGKHDTFLRKGEFDPDVMISYLEGATDRALGDGYSAIRVLGEMTWALGANLGNERLLEFESKLNLFVTSKPAVLICQYNRRLFPPEVILGVIRTHPLVLYEGEVNKNPYYVPPADFLKPDRAAQELDRLLENIRSWHLTQETLREMGARFAAAFAHAPVGMVMLAPDGQILEANPAYCKITGRTEEELKGRSIWSLTYPDDLPGYTNLWGKLVRGEIPAFVLEKRYVTKAGTILWDRQTVSLAALDRVDSRPARVIAVVEDVDERRRIEIERARLAAVVEKGSDFIGICDLELRVLFVNPAGRKLVGLGSLQEARFTRVTDYFLPEDVDFMINTVLPTALKEGSWSGELRFRHFRTGAAIPIEFYDVFTIDDPETGKPMNIATVTRDITERKRSEWRLERSFQDLRALTARVQNVREQERTRVSREIHDELGQALTAIKIDFTSLVRNLPLDQTNAAKAESVLAIVNNTIEAVRRISTELRPGILDDLGLVAALEWAAEEFETRTGIKVHKKLQEDLIADEERSTAIFRIFQETLTNIARHSQAEDVFVELADEGGVISLQVRDNGIGITNQQLLAGSSLGILGMRERASLLGGEFTIVTGPGQGTTACVRLPRPFKVAGATAL